MFDHVSASPALLQLMLGQYDWYEARSSVRERKQWAICSDLAGNLNEIRNITHLRGLVTLFIESSSYMDWKGITNAEFGRASIRHVDVGLWQT
jgi:hypothetical protein